MIETRHGLESNPVPTSILSFIAPWGAKMDVGTGLDSRSCLISIIFADLTSLHPPSEMIFILVYNTCTVNEQVHGTRAASFAQ